MSLRYGLDFGTTNSAIAIYSSGKIELLPVAASNSQPTIMPTLLYIAKDGRAYIGQEAIDMYVLHNVGHEFKKKKVIVGYTEEGPTWAYVHADMPGRFFQSLKTFLSDPFYLGTHVFGVYYSIEMLVAEILRGMKQRADNYTGQDVKAVTLGRPVYFSMQTQEDQLAEERLSFAAQLAGFEDIDFQYEPFAAALNYAQQIDEKQNVLVFDFGGGTLDFSLLELHPKSDETQRFPKRAKTQI